MHDHDLDEYPPARKPSTHRFWFSVCEDIFDHPIVGAHIKPPIAADPTKHAWSHLVMWLWMLAEAAHSDRTVKIKGDVVRLARGQLVITERFMAKRGNWNRKSAIKFFERLARHDMVRLSTISRNGQLLLDFASPKRGPTRGPTLTIVTICNYDKYQQRTKPKGATLGAARGPTGGRIPTSNISTDNTSHQSPMELKNKKDQSGSQGGIDGTDLGSNVVRLPVAPPFVIPDETRAKIEMLGCDPEAIAKRMLKRLNEGASVKNKVRYLITSAINEAHEKTNTPKKVLEALIADNRIARQSAIVMASATVREPTPEERERLQRTKAPASARSELLKTLRR